MSLAASVRQRWTPLSVAIGVVAIIVGILLGFLSVNATWIALVGAIVVLAVSVLLRDVTILLVLAVPATLVQTRVGDALSVSDLVLAAATLVAVFVLKGRGASVLQPLIWAGIGYLAMALPTLILNRYSANTLEWGHEVFLVLGSMAVGFVIGRENRARAALALYVVCCVGIGIAATAVSVVFFLQTRKFEPAYLPDLQKNTTGGMLAVAAVIAFARPVWLRWTPGWSWAAAIVCLVGVLAAQSRQGLIGAVVGILIVSLRARPQTGRRVKIVWLAAIPAVVYVLGLITEQFASGDRFNSAYQRVAWFEQSMEIWQKSPIFGVGMRWWYTDRFTANFDLFQPPNAELEVLTEVGVFGLFGFLAMFVVVGWFLWKMDPVYGTVGVAVVATRFVQGQFDIYWVAGQASLLWIIAGICYGVQEFERARAKRGEPLPWEASLPPVGGGSRIGRTPSQRVRAPRALP